MNQNKSISLSNSNNLEVRDFNYQQLNPQVRHQIQELTIDIKNRLRRCAQDVYIIGHNLCQIKQQLKHGQFRAWLEVEFDWSVSAANKFMQVSKQFHLEDLEDVDISPSALYVLAAPSTPQAIRNEALDKAQQGQTISFSFAKQLIKSNQEKPLENDPPNSVITQESHDITTRLPNQWSLLESIKNKESQLNLSIQVYSSSLFDDYLEQEWQRMLRAEQYLSLVVCQIDLESSNSPETLMFQMLEQLSYGLASSLKRGGDFVGQYGDNQCVAVLPNTDSEGLISVVDRLMGWLIPWKKNLHQFDELNTFKIYTGTISLIPRPGVTPHNLINRALLHKELIN
ncbi:diguanylate cyclase domain-containing protein [Cyanothece sp. BG0011]|uniref:diguanylate cyclase domain-containing protein n=1 Tax=Cyanothece sp. BG0011 TaxID=2082950 RepID=UPI000D1E8548|nr:diguanylate cyclase [Cyanothece sp. BG0011]